mgnify:FL=1
MLIVGRLPMTKRIGTVLHATCPVCNTSGYWQLDRIYVWFTLYWVPVFPLYRISVLACERCGSGVELESGDKVVANELVKLANSIRDKHTLADRLRAHPGADQLYQRLAAMVPRNVSQNLAAAWTSENDELAEAIEFSVYQPGKAMSRIEKILGKGVNINAVHSSGRRHLDMARYLEAPRDVIDMLIRAGAVERDAGI